MLTEDFEQAQYLSSQVEQARQRAVLAASDAGASRDGAHAAEQVAREHAKDAERVVQGAEKARDDAQAAADRAEAPTDAMVATLATNPVSLTRAAVDQATGDMITTDGSTTQAAGDARWVTSSGLDDSVSAVLGLDGSLSSSVLSAAVVASVKQGGAARPVLAAGFVQKDPYDTNLKSFGAVGNGVADDTAAVQSWVNAGAGIAPAGKYRLTAPISTNSTVNVAGQGAIFTYEGPGSYVFKFTSDNSIIDGIEITSTVKCSGGIAVTGKNPKITNCFIHDLSGVGNCTGISVNTSHGFAVANNIVDGIDSEIASGGTTSFSRAIAINGTSSAVSQGHITNNIVRNVTGWEGDAITVLFSAGGGTVPYLDGKVTVTGNVLETASRRYIKIQASRCVVTNNVMIEPTTMTFGNPSYAISVIECNNVTVSGNSIKSVLSGITVSGVTAGATWDNVVKNNSIEKLGGRGGLGIYAPSQNRFVISGNVIRNYTRAIGVSGIGGIITGNTRASVHAFSEEFITATQTSEKIATVYNVDYSAETSKSIDNLSVGAVKVGNIYLGITA